MRILVIAERDMQAKLLERALLEAGHQVAARSKPTPVVTLLVRQSAADAVVAAFDAPSPEALDGIYSVCRELPMPVVVFVQESDTATIETAIRAGVSAYVVDGLRSERVRPVLEAANVRFHEAQILRDERDNVAAKLGERKIIERAKGILMQRRNLAENAAYLALRKMAMDRGKRLAEVAETVIAAEEMLMNRL